MIHNSTNKVSTKYVSAQRIVCFENVYNKEVLLKSSLSQPVLADVETCVIEPGGYIVLDFGEEICGGIDITTQKTDLGASVHIVFGESVMEAMTELGTKNTTNDHAVRDSIISVGMYSNFRVGQTGFRFVKIQAVSACVRILCIRAACDIRDIPYRGKFESDDDKLNQIWKTGAKTVHLCMQDYLWDGIKRDRLVWLGDMHCEVSTIGAVFGTHPIVDESLQYISMLTPPDTWVNTIPSYSLWWVIIQRDWYYYTGNLNSLLQQKEYILNTVKHIALTVNDDGTDTFGTWGELSDNPNSGYFIDWESYGLRESKNGFYSVLMLALNAGCELCDILGDVDVKKICLNRISKIKATTFCETNNMQIASLMALAGLADAKVVNDRILSENPLSGMSAYLGYYTLLAKGLANDVSGAIDIINGYWGKMIELGATTFWEVFDYDDSLDAVGIDQIVPKGMKDIHGDGGNFCYKGFRKSLCHGWASGPTPFLSKYVLGITPAEPGFKKVKIDPRLGSLRFVSGTFPTPYGDIHINAEQKNSKVRFDIKVPEEIEVVK